MLIVANAWAIDSPNCAGLRHPRYESVFTHSGPVSAARTTACAGQVKCKLLVSWNAIDWSVVVQIGGQVTAISQPAQANSSPTFD